MGHHDHRFPFVELRQVLYNYPLVVGIQRIGGFVQKDVLRILVDGSGNQYPLFLPLTQTHTVLPYQSVVFQGEAHDVVVYIGNPGSLCQPFFVYFRLNWLRSVSPMEISPPNAL